jgi:hypothetical protein
MTKANSLVGFLSGIAAYSNNDVSVFHCQIESDLDHIELTWSVDGVESKVTIGDIYQDATLRAAFASMVVGTGTLTWTNATDSGRTISDLVMHLTAVFTDDAGMTWPASTTYENGTRTVHITPVVASIPSNIATMMTQIEDMLKQAVTTAVLA